MGLINQPIVELSLPLSSTNCARCCACACVILMSYFMCVILVTTHSSTKICICTLMHALLMFLICKTGTAQTFLQSNWMFAPDLLVTTPFIVYQNILLLFVVDKKTAAYYSKLIKSGGGESRCALISAHLGERISIKVVFHSNLFFFMLGLCKHNLWDCSSHTLIHWIPAGSEAEHKMSVSSERQHW